MLDHFHIMLIIGWTAYACLHSVMAAVWFKRYMERIMGKSFKYYRLLYSCIATVTLAAVLLYQFSGTSPRLFEPSNALYFAGVLFGIGGLSIMVLCIKKYFMSLSGVDVLLPKQSIPVPETKGIHFHVRHPLYSGTLLFIWALFLLFPLLSNLIACVIITVYTRAGISMEEKKLIMEFGEEYKRYAEKTPMLIPSFRKRQS